MKKNFVRLRWLFTMLLFVTTMIMPTMMLAKSITPTRPEGDGAENPYQISNAAELYWFAGLVNGTLVGVKKDASANAILTKNIIVNEYVLDAKKDLLSGRDFIEWEPIGTASWKTYTGTFNGQGHTIFGLYFYNPDASYVGLFGHIGANGKISNVEVLDSYFKFKEKGGGICGENYGELQNCSNSSTVIGDRKAGGVCGMNYIGGTVINCQNRGSVRVTEDYVGGVCGYNNSGTSIINCFNEGTVEGKNYVGGVCGYNYSGIINSCYNSANVYVSGAVNYVGSVCGFSIGEVTNCYYLSGTTEDGSAVEKSKEQFKSGEVAWLLNGKGLGEQVWGQLLGRDQYPVPGSDYKVIKAAQGDKDANGNDTYWATFSNLKNDVTLYVPFDRTLNVYNATVSGGKLTLTQRSDDQVAKGEGVLLKTNGEYVNAKANETNDLTKASSDENHLVATPAKAKTVTADAGYKLYRLTYNDATNKKGLGFYLGVAEGNSLKATPGKAYLKVSENEVKDPSSAALTRSFVFGGGNETTGIDGITIMGTDVQRHGTIEGIFDLQGRKISNPTKGIYIKNNKKVIIK